nr:HipA N-terminal domain-containing protein [Paracoccus methylarcula]
MGRRPAWQPLRVYLNNREVGTLSREGNGATRFSYHDDWLAWENAIPVSLSLPLRETPWYGAPVLRFSKTFYRILTGSADLSPKRSAPAARMPTASSP